VASPDFGLWSQGFHWYVDILKVLKAVSQVLDCLVRGHHCSYIECSLECSGSAGLAGVDGTGYPTCYWGGVLVDEHRIKSSRGGLEVAARRLL
jgi:hypothetical protein